MNGRALSTFSPGVYRVGTVTLLISSPTLLPVSPSSHREKQHPVGVQGNEESWVFLAFTLL